MITVIINTYPNPTRDQDLSRLLNSIYVQTYQEFCILIVENFKDLSRIRPVLKPFNQKKQKISTIFDSKKKLSYLFNLGWKNAKSEYLAYIADDAEADKNWLTNIALEFERDKATSIATGPVLSTCYPVSEMHRLYILSRTNMVLRLLAWPYLHFATEDKILEPGILFESGAYSLGAALPQAVKYRRRLIDLATTTSMGIRRSVLLKLGGFDERFNFNHADGDLFIRVKKMGGNIVFNPKIQVKHHVRVGLSRNAYFIGKDTGMYYKKHIRPKSFSGFVGLALNLLVLNSYWLYNAIRTRNVNQLRGISGFVEGIMENTDTA